MRNPFTPTFGIVPPNLAGRSDVLASMARAFDDGLGNPNLSSLVVGPRGSGKTVLLSCIADEAFGHGWVAAKVTALPGMLEDILERTEAAASEFVKSSRKPRVSGVGIAQLVELEFKWDDPGRGNWRTRMNALLDALAEYDIGLLITVDEVRSDLDEMVQLAAVYQHFVEEGRKVALALAGLPHHIDRLVNDKSVSFLRRSRRLNLGRIADADVENALRKTVVSAGRSIGEAALARCTAAADGFPYMMQLVGFWAWEACSGPEIGDSDAERGIRQARGEMRTGVLDATYRELSDGDLRFLQAMLADEDESRLADIAARMDVGSNYASRYKSRLLERGVIGQRPRGGLGFDLPGFKEYLEEEQ